MMDVSFSAWRHSREESLQLKGDSFSFLFDRRYTNRLNRMSRVFFEAYVVATKELAAQEDRFPSLSEIDAKMESGAVYAFKDRLMKNTEFFEEVKISGVSYLVPRALRFVDVTGMYTDLILSFEEGTVVLPTRRKTPLPPEARAASHAETVTAKPSEADDSQSSSTVNETLKQDSVEARPPAYPQHMAEAFEEISSEETTIEVPLTSPRPNSPNVQSPPVTTISKEISEVHVEKPERKPDEKRSSTLPFSSKAIALLVAAILIAIASALFFSVSPPSQTIDIGYSAYIDNTSNESYLGLDIVNPHEMANDMEMALPANIDKSISARGGIVTISHGDNTLVRLNSSTDANVKIYLLGNWTTIPVGLSFNAPEGFDSSLQVHGQDYYVTRKNETLVLMFNLTGEGVSFEQSYIKKS